MKREMHFSVGQIAKSDITAQAYPSCTIKVWVWTPAIGHLVRYDVVIPKLKFRPVLNRGSNYGVDDKYHARNYMLDNVDAATLTMRRYEYMYT